ncbi:MAG TPA: hypothetical protein VE172_01265 [Stackebrandtia sp.]|jgi:hypothetical protein|uniref:hypothetical protein n=1 Tax=Stackebrandtia sp. TaxID=2023065 RepID=UPI002D4E8782|nr:hypothetical protein [Stackebrandtia sp.]HZE37417.1 hypothetical protein [Stackebrandtia sp.]
MTNTSIQIPSHVVAATVRGLIKGFRFAEARALLEAADGADDAEVAVARAELMVNEDWYAADATTEAALAACARIVEAHGGPEDRWEMEYWTMRAAYGRMLFPWTGQWTSSRGRGRELSDMEAVRSHATALRDNAPDGRRRGWAEFYLGLIGDNVFGERTDSPGHFAAALRAGREHGDDHLTFEALRHLGDHSHDAGEHDLTRQRWEDSARHAARAGLVGPTLAQLLLVAVTARDHGDDAGALLLARMVSMWATEIGFRRISDQAESFIKGDDPTAGPEPEN